jgi:hypothetical protein
MVKERLWALAAHCRFLVQAKVILAGQQSADFAVRAAQPEELAEGLSEVMPLAKRLDSAQSPGRRIATPRKVKLASA